MISKELKLNSEFIVCVVLKYVWLTAKLLVSTHSNIVVFENKG
jgi:hypothetical protein